MVIVFDLSSRPASFQFEFFFNKSVSEFMPVMVRVCDKMGIEIAGGSAKFCGKWHLIEGA